MHLGKFQPEWNRLDLVLTFFHHQAAITIWKRDRKTNPKEHWLEHAQESQGKKLVMETKILLHVLLLFLPLPLFWALFDQQGSRWTIQATKMNLDNEYFSIKPDQMQVVNPLLILTFIPLCEYVIYPLLNCIGVRRPLQKMTIGGLLAGAAFVCSAVVQLLIDISDPYTVNVVWQIPQYAIMTLGEVKNLKSFRPCRLTSNFLHRSCSRSPAFSSPSRKRPKA